MSEKVDFSDEQIDIVDDRDTIVGKAHWKDVIEKGLLHRSANIMVFNSEGKIFVHRRADHLKLYGGMWDVKFGGHVSTGESYEDGARRELFEEAGIKDTELIFLFVLAFRSKTNNANRKVFKCVYDGELKLQESEVAEGRFVSMEEVKKMLEVGKMSPSAANVFEEYMKNEKS